VRRREYQGGWHYYLNLRARGLRGERVTIRDPGHSGWPDHGRVARTLDEALEWSDAYVCRLGLDWCRGVESMTTVADCAHAYLTYVLEEKGAGSSSYRHSRSHVRRHILPAVGSVALRRLGIGQVQNLIDEMKTVDGRRAGNSLKEGTLAMLSNVWQHACPSDPVPWQGKVTIDHRDPGRARRERAANGIRNSRRSWGFTLDELRWIPTVAVAVNLAGQRNPMKRRGLDNSQDLIAFLTYHMVRIEEVCFLRGFDFHGDLNAFLIPGTKTAAAEERLTPIQRAYQPWLEHLLSSLDRDDDFLLPTSSPRVLPSVHTAEGEGPKGSRSCWAEAARPADSRLSGFSHIDCPGGRCPRGRDRRPERAQGPR